MSPEHLFDYGFAGAGILILGGLSFYAVKMLVRLNEKTSEALRGLSDVISKHTGIIEKCKGPSGHFSSRG